MKLMKKLLLIHWHYFTHELIEFDKINFLTGKNASGKSTIIDALQLLLLSDTSGSFFNKAANGKSARTLVGYLRGELGDDGGAGYRFLRNGRFTSYICAEFYDDVKKSSFTAGCCFDYYSENDIQKLLFYFDGTIPKNEFIEDETPMDIRALRQYLKHTYSPNHKYTTETNKDFREKLYGKLGGLPQKFGTLLKKAVPFNPIADIQKFITEFVCDEQQNIDIGLIQENIRHYQSLEEESAKLQTRMQALEQINETYDRYRDFENQERLYQYLLDRSDLELQKKKQKDKQELILHHKRLIEQNENLRNSCKSQKEKLNEEYTAKIADLKNDKASLTIERLNDQKNHLIEEIQTTTGHFEHYQMLFSKTFADWKQKIQEAEKIEKFDLSVFEPAFGERILSFLRNAQRLKQEGEKLLSNTSASLLVKAGQKALESLAEKERFMGQIAYELNGRLEEEKHKTVQQIHDEQQELAQLHKGIYRYPRCVTDLREAILSELRGQFGKEAQVDILAQLIEIKSDRWRNTIEGYMNTQKLYLIVKPEHFQTALTIYNRVKEKRNIYGVRLVDIGRIQKRNPICQRNSLAEEIETDHPMARLYIDYLLGRVIKCDHVSQLRNYSVAVTDEGMLYQGYTVGRIDPKTWKFPVIGQSAIQKKIQYLEQHLQHLRRLESTCIGIKSAVSQLANLCGFSVSDIEQAIACSEKFLKIPLAKKQIQEIEQQIANISTEHLVPLKKSIEELKEQIQEYEGKIDAYQREITKLQLEIENATREIPLLEKKIEAAQLKIQENYSQSWLHETGEPKFSYERNAKKSLEEISQNFYSPLMKASKNKEAKWTALRDLRHDYVNVYKVGYDIDDRSNTAFENEWLELSESKLPEYQAKIADARKKALEQFQEDFLSRLQANIKSAEDQIRRLNDAIRVNFGNDTYRFKIVPKEEYRRYYDMITSNMLLNGYNLLSQQFNETYKEEINELFSLITKPEPGGTEDYDKRVREFTNYRTYLSFDLEVLDQEGNTQRLSRTLLKKSGGETQTPFYIAVLASFAQIYRIGRDKSANTARIIIFDEAFSKMDGDRIEQSIALLRQFNFQVILSAPPDKIGDIATLVDRNLCVLRQGNEAFVRSFTPKQIGALYESN
ncbi:MAG: hypothetical protein ACFWUC_00065 [Oscillospiraceae bacterium]